MSLDDAILAGLKLQLVQAEDFKRLKGGNKSDEYIAYLHTAIAEHEARMRDSRLRDDMGVTLRDVRGTYEVER